MKASVRQVLLSVEVGEASLVGESAGYIVLGAADRALVRASVAHASSVFIDAEGQVHLDGTDADAAAVEASLRIFLGELLGRVRTPCPNLERVAQRRECRGLSTLVAELEAALVPVNRRAARRSLGRLCRDAERSRHLEWTRARVEPVAQADYGLGHNLPSFEPSPAPLQVGGQDGGFLAPSPPAHAVQVFDAPAVAELQTPLYADGALSAIMRESDVELHANVQALLDQEATPLRADEGEVADEEPTRLFAPAVHVVPESSEVAAATAVPDLPVAPAASEVPPVPELSPPLEFARPALRKVKALGAWRSVGPELPDDVPLVEVPQSTQPRRPSDVSELLARIQLNEPVRVELLEGLRQLAHVDHTPVPAEVRLLA